MVLSKLKDKGKIILPSSIRKEIHADKGGVFNFQLQADGTIIVKKSRQLIRRSQDCKEKRERRAGWELSRMYLRVQKR